MSISRMANAMNYIDDDLIAGALEDKRTKKKDTRVKWSVMAACLCLVVVGAAAILPNMKRAYNIGITPLPKDTAGMIPSSESADPIEGTDTPLPVGGGHMGDDLYSPYCGFVDIISYEKGTFSENYANYMDKFVAMEGKWENDRPALMYYLACEMKLTRKDLETYYTAVWRGTVPESVYAGLLADTLEESMQLLKSEYAFYHDGKLYTVYDIYEMQKADALPFDISDAAYDSVWESISAYLKTKPSYEYSEDLKQFVNIHLPANKN